MLCANTLMRKSDFDNAMASDAFNFIPASLFCLLRQVLGWPNLSLGHLLDLFLHICDIAFFTPRSNWFVQICRNQLRVWLVFLEAHGGIWLDCFGAIFWTTCH